jgi:hypothetical protein
MGHKIIPLDAPRGGAGRAQAPYRSACRACCRFSMRPQPEGYFALVGKGKFRRLLLSGLAEEHIGLMECRLIRRSEAEGEVVSVVSFDISGVTTMVVAGEEGEGCLFVLSQVKGPARTVFKTPYLLCLSIAASADCRKIPGTLWLHSFPGLGLGFALVHRLA